MFQVSLTYRLTDPLLATPRVATPRVRRMVSDLWANTVGYFRPDVGYGTLLIL